MSVKRYNLYNFEAQFKQYLSAGNISPISSKNYLSDIRHFFGWLTFDLQSQIKTNNIDENNIIGLIDENIIRDYKSYLTDNNLPIKTVNRRLSTIRKFCTFCISQGWMKENFAKHVSNAMPSRTNKETGLKTDILKQFQSDLEKESIDQQNIISCLDDVQEFLQVTNLI